MNEKRHGSVQITQHFYQLGIPSFPSYLSLGDDGMIIEGGTGATFPFIVEQIEELGIEPERIKYLTLTHTHADHIGALPHLRKLWSHLKVVASPIGAELLKKEAVIKEFIWTDGKIAEIMMANGVISDYPPKLDSYDFSVDILVNEGDRIELGQGIAWTVYEAAGHAPCHIALHEEKEGTLVIGDTTGFNTLGKDVFWPNYFHSLEAYCNTIKKLSAISAKRLALSHNGVIESGISDYFRRAIGATESYHLEMLERVGNGEDPSEVALEKAKWVNTLTDILPFSVMEALSKLLIRRSQSEADKEGLFDLP
ncbi:MBL fold metallo-hydrolase [Chloroflexota bacterium]